MKKILITGANSYIGTSVEKWLSKYPDEYLVDTIDMKTEEWKKKDFSPYDVVFHVAGIAHVKETKKNKEIYYKVNRDLAYETVKKAKSEGVKQFIFLSTMSVYGLKEGVIDKNTPLDPKNNYGKSKLQAEALIKNLNDDLFRVAILRPPMVYGNSCKGNYSKLSKLAKLSPVFPDVNSKRSMIYIDNLSEFVRLIVDNNLNGIYFPQNLEYVNITELVKVIAKTHNKNIFTTSLFNPFIDLLCRNNSIFKKVFGSLIYDQNMSNNDLLNYCLFDLIESIKLTEN